MFKIREYEDPTSFASACVEWLYRREDYHNGLISLTNLLISRGSVFSPPFWFVSIHRGDEIVGCGTFARPDGLLATDLPLNVLREVAQRLTFRISHPRRLVGHPRSVTQLAIHVSDCVGNSSRLECNWNIYRLDAPRSTALRTEPGQMRLCESSERDMVAEWGHQYGIEAPAPIDVQDFVLRKMDENLLFVWDENGPRNGNYVSPHYKWNSYFIGIHTKSVSPVCPCLLNCKCPRRIFSGTRS